MRPQGKGAASIPDVADHYSDPASVDHYAYQRGLHPKEVVAFALIAPGSRVLDLGCGGGRTTEVLAEQGHDVIGMDVAPALIEAARKRLPHLRFQVGDATALEFPDACFDAVVFSFNGLDCVWPFESRRQVLREVRRVLVPRGTFVFSAHNNCLPRGLDGVVPFVSSFFRRSRATYIVDRWDRWSPQRMYLATPELQVEELEQEGFELVELVPRRALRWVRSRRLLGLIDAYTYYVARRTD